ncbi:MAG: hypothetical protein APF77_13460 [Clostridia bacterium BRH_c25]|nr:MAG: hypothetical protein APF77_13460 [Clostridia bacterium BRH_c25]
MLIKSKRVFSLLICILFITSTLSGCSSYSDVSAKRSVIANADEKLIDEESLIGIVQELSSEKYAGRMAGTKGNEAAALYIAGLFKKIDLINPEGLDNYMQRYPQTVITLKDLPKLSISSDGDKTSKEFKYVDNFVIRSLSSKTYDINIDAPLYLIEDLKEINAENQEIRGKLLLISWELRFNRTLNEILELLNSSGAAGALGGRDALAVTPMLGSWLEGEHYPFIDVDNDTFAELVSAYGKGRKASFHCSFMREDNKKVPNVVGLLPGTDEKLKDQYIIIGAHFDHVGQNMDGSFNPGGLDNASGVAAMLEIARVLKENKTAPSKPVLFIAFNGEEGGLLGSEYYAEHPIYPIDNSVMICMDMVGSSEKLPLMIKGVGGRDLNLRNLMHGLCKKLGIDAVKEIGYGSDHESFAYRGLNSVMLINEDFNNGYHSPEDTSEDVDKVRLEEVVKLVLYYIDKNAYN